MKTYGPTPQNARAAGYSLPESYLPVPINAYPKNYFYTLPDPAYLMANQPPRPLGFNQSNYNQVSAWIPEKSTVVEKKIWERPDSKDDVEDIAEKFSQMKFSSPPCQVIQIKKDSRATARANKGIVSNQLKMAKFFILKSYTKENIDKAIECGYWASTSKGNRILNDAYKTARGEYPVLLFFSVNGSTNFYGVAEMKSEVDENLTLSDWKEKWRGLFRLEWLFLKEIPNKNFKNIKNSLNSYRVFPSSRNAQEVPLEEGLMALKIFELYEGQVAGEFY